MAINGLSLSQNYKWYRSKPSVVVDIRDKAEYPRDDEDTFIRIYADQVIEWFLNFGRDLHYNAGFVVLQIAMSQIEGIQQYWEGKSSKDGPGKCFRRGAKRILKLDKPADSWLKDLYNDARCGLFHDGMTRHRILVDNDRAHAIEHDPIDGYIIISPKKLLGAVRADFTKYIDALRNNSDPPRRQLFVQLWRQRHPMAQIAQTPAATQAVPSGRNLGPTSVDPRGPGPSGAGPLK